MHGLNLKMRGGGYGIAFIVTPMEEIKGNTSTGMAYYGNKDSLVIEMDSYFNGGHCNFDSSEGTYVNWVYDNQIYANSGFGYLQGLADDTRNNGLEYDWVNKGPAYWTKLNNWGYASLPDSSERRFDHIGVMKDGVVREHHGISYLNGLKPDEVKNGKYVNVNAASASTASDSSKCATRFADAGDIDVLGEGVDNRLFTLWVDYDGENLYVRYANGSFLEAARPENAQIAMEKVYGFSHIFTESDVHIGFLSSISEDSMANHTLHSFAFANTYFENGIPNDYVLNNEKVKAAKKAVQQALENITVKNDTTGEKIQEAVNDVLKNASSDFSDVTVTVGDITKTEATVTGEGNIRGTITVRCGDTADTIIIDKTIAKLPENGNTGNITEGENGGTGNITEGENGGTGNITEEENTSVSKLVRELKVSKKTAEKILAMAGKYDISMETLLIGEDTFKKQQSEGDVKGSTFYRLQAAGSKTTAKSVKLTWKNVRGADGYQIYAAKCGRKNKWKLVKDIRKGSTKTFTQKKLNKGTAYKYVVRGYKMIDGRKITIAASKCVYVFTDGGKYGNTKSVKVKKTKVNLKRGKTYQVKASQVKEKKALKKYRNICYESTNPKVAAVSGKGLIRAKAKGTCKVYVYAQNGKQKEIKVTVK